MAYSAARTGTIEVSEQDYRALVDERRQLRAALEKIANDEYTAEDQKWCAGKPAMIWNHVARKALGQE